MKDSCFLTFNKDGITGMRKKRPPLKSGEFAVKVNIEVPKEIFKQSIPEANLTIPKEMVLHPPVEMQIEEPIFGKKKTEKTKAK